jgi:hypothetical protein
MYYFVLYLVAVVFINESAKNECQNQTNLLFCSICTSSLTHPYRRGCFVCTESIIVFSNFMNSVCTFQWWGTLCPVVVKGHTPFHHTNQHIWRKHMSINFKHLGWMQLLMINLTATLYVIMGTCDCRYCNLVSMIWMSRSLCTSIHNVLISSSASDYITTLIISEDWICTLCSGKACGLWKKVMPPF